MLAEALLEEFAVPVRNRNLLWCASDSIPKGLNVVHLFFDGQPIEARRRIRNSSVHGSVEYIAFATRSASRSGRKTKTGDRQECLSHWFAHGDLVKGPGIVLNSRRAYVSEFISARDACS